MSDQNIFGVFFSNFRGVLAKRQREEKKLVCGCKAVSSHWSRGMLPRLMVSQGRALGRLMPLVARPVNKAAIAHSAVHKRFMATDEQPKAEHKPKGNPPKTPKPVGGSMNQAKDEAAAPVLIFFLFLSFFLSFFLLSFCWCLDAPAAACSAGVVVAVQDWRAGGVCAVQVGAGGGRRPAAHDRHGHLSRRVGKNKKKKGKRGAK